MNKLKNFFEKKKLDSKFKQAGSGHRLDSEPKQGSSSQPVPPAVRQAPNANASKAGDAALARLANQQKTQQRKPASTTATWKSKAEIDNVMRNEIESMKTQVSYQPKVIVKDHSLAVDGLFFTCPVYPACLPWGEIHQYLKECLLKDLSDEPLMISVTMIHTLNINKTQKEAGINIIGKYLQNILEHPGEEKYRKIRKGNKVFQEKVCPLIGVEEFLIHGVGFELQMMPSTPRDEPSNDEEYYVLDETHASNVEHLQTAKEMLTQAEGLEIVLDRNLKVFKPSQHANQIKVPDSFFNITSDEAKNIQQQMTNDVEKAKELRTKAMREADSGPKRIYKYCIIRVRLPDGVILQGTFKASENLFAVKEFVKQQLFLDWIPFDLVDSIGKSFPDETATIFVLKLTPAAVLNAKVDSTVTNEIAASSSDGKIRYLKDEVFALLQDS